MHRAAGARGVAFGTFMSPTRASTFVRRSARGRMRRSARRSEKRARRTVERRVFVVNSAKPAGCHLPLGIVCPRWHVSDRGRMLAQPNPRPRRQRRQRGRQYLVLDIVCFVDVLHRAQAWHAWDSGQARHTHEVSGKRRAGRAEGQANARGRKGTQTRARGRAELTAEAARIARH
jgi:hypothetical protein